MLTVMKELVIKNSVPNPGMQECKLALHSWDPQFHWGFSSSFSRNAIYTSRNASWVICHE